MSMNKLDQNLKELQKTKRSMVLIVIAAIVGAAIYFISGSKVHAAIVVGIVVGATSMYHTPVAIMALLFFFPIEGAFELSKIGAGSRAIGLLVVASYVINKFRLKVVIPREMIPILIFTWFALMSFLWAHVQQATYNGIVALILNVILIIILINTIRDEKNLRFILWAVFLGSITSAFMIIFGQVGYSAGGEAMGRVVLSEGTNPVVLGNSLLLGFLSAFYLFNEKERFAVLGFLVFGPILLYGILKTQNRTALASFVLAPVMGFLFAAKGKYLVKSVVSIVLVTLLGLSVLTIALTTDVLSDQAKARLRGTQSDGDLGGRSEQWKAGLELLSKRPIFGWGYKNFQEMFPEHKGVRAAHNDLVSIAESWGLLAQYYGFQFTFFYL